MGSTSDNLANDRGKRAGIYTGVIMGEWGAKVCGNWQVKKKAAKNRN